MHTNSSYISCKYLQQRNSNSHCGQSKPFYVPKLNFSRGTSCVELFLPVHIMKSIYYFLLDFFFPSCFFVGPFPLATNSTFFFCQYCSSSLNCVSPSGRRQSWKFFSYLACHNSLAQWPTIILCLPRDSFSRTSYQSGLHTDSYADSKCEHELQVQVALGE